MRRNYMCQNRGTPNMVVFLLLFLNPPPPPHPHKSKRPSKKATHMLRIPLSRCFLDLPEGAPGATPTWAASSRLRRRGSCKATSAAAWTALPLPSGFAEGQGGCLQKWLSPNSGFTEASKNCCPPKRVDVLLVCLDLPTKGVRNPA